MLTLKAIEKNVKVDEVKTTFNILTNDETVLVTGNIVIITGEDIYVVGSSYDMKLQEIV